MKITSSAIIIGLVLFVLGIGLGLMFGPDERPQVDIQDPIVLEETTEQEKKVLTLLKSEMLKTIQPDVEAGLIRASFAGYVAEIGEDTMIITSKQEKLELRMFPYVHISRVLPQQEDLVIELVDIQEGEMVNIHATITEQGELLAKLITVQ